MPRRGAGDERSIGGDQVEGRNAVRELLRAGRRRVREVWISETRESTALDEIRRLAADGRVPVRQVDQEALRARAKSEAPQGVLALAAAVEAVPLDALARDPAAFLVALDGITDPGNLGAVLRSAETAGATGIVLPRHRSARLSPAAVKAAAGAVEYLPIATVAGVPSALEQLRRAEVWSVGLEAGAPSSIFDLDVVEGPVAIVLGAEGGGLARLTRERCDVLASIALHGRIESLNVATAAAVACHAVAQRRSSRDS
jgi:23S rRNA (guanosine2251-2'-O)-methyltransferase